MNHIELFAGCGGLSLGLETAGFELLLANELSPMASETFAYNHLCADLTDDDPSHLEKVFWISSQFPKTEIQKRLRENPNEACGLTKRKTDLINLKEDALKRSLLIGSIVDLNKLLKKDTSLIEKFTSEIAPEGIDLVSGGPPCQSFSMAGMRDHTNQRNQLPWEFAKFVEKVQPRIAVLENVTGILRAFSIEGKKYHAWFEVAKAFAKKGYVPLCLHINAKYVGAAQNRPRFIMIALREDVANDIDTYSDDSSLNSALEISFKFFNAVKSRKKVKFGDLPYYDIIKNYSFFKKSKIFSKFLVKQDGELVRAQDALDDLRKRGKKESSYIKHINSVFHKVCPNPIDKQKNNELRRNNPHVQARFRLFQIMNTLETGQAREVSKYLRSLNRDDISNDVLDHLLKEKFTLPTGEKVKFGTRTKLLNFLKLMHTKKQTQKALFPDKPAPAALSIPDDACHYHENELRTLTVREMARIQSFPDWYEFRSKVTTGGQMRKFEVPQYTQVGNAVPPLLGIVLGKVCADLLKISEK